MPVYNRGDLEERTDDPDRRPFWVGGREPDKQAADGARGPYALVELVENRSPL
jgi:hypothetical protein